MNNQKIRIVTASSLFDGHDAAINIMRRILQSSGAEVIHLGHDRSVQEIINCAIQEDANAIAITSYQGGHMEFFKYMYDLLHENNCGHIKIFGGGGGTILPSEIEELQAYGITRIYSPDDGREMGLQGMINDLISKCKSPSHPDLSGQALPYEKKFDVLTTITNLKNKNWKSIAELISLAENESEKFKEFYSQLSASSFSPARPELVEGGRQEGAVILGITGTGGAGKSSLVDELVRRFLNDFTDKTIAIISVDPSKRKTGGALLGDRIRMNAINHERVYMRSLATRQSNLSLSRHVKESVDVLKLAQYDLIIVETSGIGQSDTEITDIGDLSLYVMTPEYGAPTQLEKIDMLDFADFIAINKFDKKGAADALRDVKKQYKRNRNLWETDDDTLPVFGTIASHFNDYGMNCLYRALMSKIETINPALKSNFAVQQSQEKASYIIPPHRVRYLSEITENNRNYDVQVNEQAIIADKLQAIINTIQTINKIEIDLKGVGIDDICKYIIKNASIAKQELTDSLCAEYEELKNKLHPENKQILEHWANKKLNYEQPEFIFKVREQELKIKTHSTSLSQLSIPKVVLPEYKGWGDILRWILQENVPGEFPYTAGNFNFKREGEDPTRMFAGEGAPEKTNRRFHYLSINQPAHRLSTAFDSVTLYGRNPDMRPDIYGKVGNSGVSVCCLDDVKKLYSGFNLSDPKTSVSMTINGPAAIITGFFMNAAIDQQCELYIKQHGLEQEVKEKIKTIYQQRNTTQPVYNGKLPEGNDGLGLLLLGVTGDQVLPTDIYENIKKQTLSAVRGTVQADILKEDQGQNTCIFSTEFSLRMMGDMQEYFIHNQVRNFYSVSISGYHIAEAGANPITQLALTLSNGFTYIEYYLSRGMDINKFAPNLSFFFSNGLDPEYSVIGRVARRIWAKALKYKYKANERSQMLKYHIQTSGRSLHAQEIDFNDIRTTLQALYAIYDNCNSLHTNAYDEAITTPTEESVRRAMAIQLIINKELGMTKNENPLQGSFFIEKLTNMVEQAVLDEFDRINERGGVLGAMETMYQRSKIQEESMHYEMLKHSGEIPIVGVNTFLSSKGSPTIIPKEVIRASEAEKNEQISMLDNFHKTHSDKAQVLLNKLQHKAVTNSNIFEELMETSKYCSLGQITHALFDVGGQYRRNM